MAPFTFGKHGPTPSTEMKELREAVLRCVATYGGTPNPASASGTANSETSKALDYRAGTYRRDGRLTSSPARACS
jgi:hypothetical protein